jgi:hypothetical protein
MDTSKMLKMQDGVATLERPRFSAGLLLEDADLTAAVEYPRSAMRLLFRSLFGCGVICGLDVTANRRCRGSHIEVTVSQGVALDARGNPIEVPRSTTFTYESNCLNPPPTIWVVLCYTEKPCRPRDVSCHPDDDMHVEQTRSHDGFLVKLYSARPKCACACAPADDTPPSRPSDGCCPDETPPVATTPGVARPNATYDRCDCYADHFAGKCACECACDCVALAVIDTTQRVSATGCKPLGEDHTSDVALCVDLDVRRRIRPVLNGYLMECVPPKAAPRPRATPVDSPPSDSHSHGSPNQ